jgi:hypothetical protein
MWTQKPHAQQSIVAMATTMAGNKKYKKKLVS